MNNDIVEGELVANHHIDGKLILKNTYVITVYNPENTNHKKGLLVYTNSGELIGKTDTNFLRYLK